MNSKFDAIMDVLQPLMVLPGQVARIEVRLDELSSDVKVVKAAVTDLSVQVQDIDLRVQRLEAKA
ncbi:MAG TPA: hypothetical protein VIR03_00465 [Candidatus Saccharimonadales bacterium]